MSFSAFWTTRLHVVGGLYVVNISETEHKQGLRKDSSIERVHIKTDEQSRSLLFFPIPNVHNALW